MENKFTVDYASILKKIKAINPVKYAHSRNYIDGQVNYLMKISDYQKGD